jgi:hypothetical protein
MKHQIVVARYDEDISYLQLFKDNIIVYNKGNYDIPIYFNIINLPNIGRESHTYLYHIITNYNNLADKTLFIQGRISDHKLLPFDEYFKDDNLFVGRESSHNIEMLKKDIDHSGKYLIELKKGDLKKSKYTPYEWINKVGFNISKLQEFKMIWGANFSISKEIIQSKSKLFYENLIKYIDYDRNPEEGHFFERFWHTIFNQPIIEKKIILYQYIENINNDIIDKCNFIIKNNNIKDIHLWTNNDANDNLKIKYLNTNKYIDIYPNIIDNLFQIKINNKVFIKLKFDNNIIYNITFNNNNITIDIDENVAIYNININFLENIVIKWYNSMLLFIQNNIVLLYLINNSTLLIKSIKIKSLSAIINYQAICLKKIKIFRSDNDQVNKIFYKDNYENYYIEKLLNYI